MSIFAFAESERIGIVRQTDTARVWVHIDSAEAVARARVGRLVAVKGGDANEWVVGVVARVWRRPVKDSAPTVDRAGPDEPPDPEVEENGIEATLVGTYRAREGAQEDHFTRALLALPSVDEPVYRVEGDALQSFMAIVSSSSVKGGHAALQLGYFALDSDAKACVNGDKLFQRHAALVGSTGSGKSWAVASILEQAAKLPSVNIIVFDLHGEYSSLDYTRGLRIAGPGDLEAPGPDVLFLPYWLLNNEEMQPLFVDQAESEARNQSMLLREGVREAKREFLAGAEQGALLETFTIDSPVPFDLGAVQGGLERHNTDMVEGARAGTEKQGPYHGKLDRCIARMGSRLADRRYGFMFALPTQWRELGALDRLADALLGHGEQTNGVKVIDFSEVPSDVLPVMVSLVARLVFQLQLWAPAPALRHPVLLVCDEAHLYLPNDGQGTTVSERRALENFGRIAKEGRKHGVGLLVVSQRPADVSSTILSQCNNIICLRLTNETDQSVVRRHMPEALAGLVDVMPVLDIGEALVVGDAILLPARVHLSEPTCKPTSSTIDFWTEWSDPNAHSDLRSAAEGLRRQTRVTLDAGSPDPDSASS